MLTNKSMLTTFTNLATLDSENEDT
jgi:hypothetical protein